MEPTAVLDALEQGGRLDATMAVPGLSQAYFDRILEMFFGSDLERAGELGRKWRSILKLGDDPSYTHRAKGLGEWAEGKWRAAAKSFLEAGRLQRDGTWSFALPAVDALGRAGDVTEALRVGEMLRDKVYRDPVNVARLAINVGNVHEQADQLLLAQQCYWDAAEILEYIPEREVDFAKALSGLAACHWQLGRVTESRAASLRAREIFEREDQTINVDVCSGNLAQVAFLEGRLDEAVLSLTDVRSRAEGARKPWIAEMLGFVYRRLNLIPEAVDCFEEALHMEEVQAVGRANVLAGLGLSLLDLGQSELGAKHITQARRVYLRLQNNLMPALLDLEVSRHALGRKGYRQAARLAEDASRVFLDHGATRDALLAQSVAVESELLGALALRDVSMLCEDLTSSRDPNLVWRGKYLFALVSGGSRSLYRSMLKSLLESRLLLSSPLSRAAYWGDKRRAIDAYLGFLLGSGLRKDVDEAYSVVSRVRSATLIDEILGSTFTFDERQRASLEELRSHLNILSEAAGVPPHLRFSTRAARIGRAVSRRWHETAKEVLSGAAADVTLQRAPDCATIVSVNGGYQALTPLGHAIPFAKTVREVERIAAAFRFECMEPLVDPTAGARHCMEALRELWAACYLPLAASEVKEICPEDGLWSVPWQAFPLLSDQNWELALRLTPSVAQPSAAGAAHGAGVAVWIGANDALPNIARERDLLRQRFPEAVICETREQVLAMSAGKSIDLVHVSAHGRHQDGNPMFSSIDFPDGPLYAAEIAALDFRVRRAVLLSCESGRVSIPFRREPDGLARAFLARGAEEVVGSSWLLDDDAALELFATLYHGNVAGSFSDGLARARRKLLARFEHPFYWAGPVLIRGYGIPHAPTVGPGVLL